MKPQLFVINGRPNPNIGDSLQAFYSEWAKRASEQDEKEAALIRLARKHSYCKSGTPAPQPAA